MRRGRDSSPVLTPCTWKRRDWNLGLAVPRASSVTLPRCLLRADHITYLATNGQLEGLRFMEFERDGHTTTTTYLPSLSLRRHSFTISGAFFFSRTFWNFLE